MGVRPVVRRMLRRLRRPTIWTANFANRFTAVTRYAFDLIIWSRLFSQQSPLAQTNRWLRERRIESPAPVLHVSGDPAMAEIWETGFTAVYNRLLINLQLPDMLSRIRYAHPAPAFRGIYLWDSAFIAQIWKAWDVSASLDVNLAVVDQAEGGRLQHVVAHMAKSPFTQPPLIAWSLNHIHAWADDEQSLAAVRRAYPVLKQYNTWLYANRRLSNGLFFWRHPYESGVENAPRFSSRDERVLADTTRLAAPDLCAYVMLQNEAMQEMAEALGADEDARRFHRKRIELRQRMNELLWCDEDGLYYDLNLDDGNWVRSRTIASLMPLWAGAPDDAMAERLMTRIMDPKQFNPLMPLPSVAVDDPDFERDMWRGAVWINTAYGVLLGLERYGYAREASELAFRLADAVYRTQHACHSIFEFYDPFRHDITQLHRKRGNRWKQFTLGGKPRADFVGWSGLVNTLVVEQLLGFRRCGRTMTIRPRMPQRAVGMAFALRLPAEGVTLEIEVLDDQRTRGALRRRAGCERFDLDFGEAYDTTTESTTENARRMMSCESAI